MLFSKLKNYIVMKKNALLTLLLLCPVLFFTSCEKDDLDSEFKIEGLTIDNYPRVDGSTSTAPLNTLVACKLLGISYQWETLYDGSRSIVPKLNNNSDKFWELVKSSQTHQSFINLINKDADIILTAREMSPDEKLYANSQGVNLIETPIALDAFVFIVHPDNPIKSLSIKQIQDIYTGKITNWREVGGNDAKINPYVRNPNSGSQELMESLVMKGLNSPEFPVSYEFQPIFSMMMTMEYVSFDVNAICYTVYYYKETILRDVIYKTKSIGINGTNPNMESISMNTYPLVADVYAVIRSDLDKSSMAYKLYELLKTRAGRRAIRASGYLTK